MAVAKGVREARSGDPRARRRSARARRAASGRAIKGAREGAEHARREAWRRGDRASDAAEGGRQHCSSPRRVCWHSPVNRAALVDRLAPLATSSSVHERLRSACVIADSGLFDAAQYAEHHPEAASKYQPLIHYVLWGAREGRRPHPLFDPAYYMARYPDVARSQCEPLSHFLQHGAGDQRSPIPLFDSRYYIETYPEVRSSGINPLVDFVNIGWREGRNPSPEFDCAAYVARYEDARESGLNPLVHYLEIGRERGRRAIAVAETQVPAPPRIGLTSKSIRPRGVTPPLILCLTHVSPFPAHAGNAYRIQRMLTALQASGFRILPVIVPLSGEDPDEESIQESRGTVRERRRRRS